ncbi:MAG TPA: hypothetical protein GX005_03540 [Bacteroidales bacterium]|nr:hypothetical protein [Bacteroidales bacterium]
MATPSPAISPQELEELAYIYIDECLANTKQQLSNKGDIKEIKDRHIPTIGYFLRIWIPKFGKPTISRTTYYAWLNLEVDEEDLSEKAKEHSLKLNTIKNIDAVFKDLAVDIVANEGKGIFYAKNRLGMRDIPKEEEKQVQEIIFKFGNSE